MNPYSTNAKLFSLLNFEFIAPSFILKEFEKYQKECLQKSKLKKSDFLLRKKEIFSRIKLIEFNEYKNMLEKAKKFSPDIDDSPYFALALKQNSPIWSNDKELKNQNEIKVFSTEDMINLLF